MLLPTTKAKQRDFLDTLIDAVVRRQITHAELLRNLRALRGQLHNRKALRGRQTAPPTRPMRARIQRLHALYPHYSMQEIAQHLKISIGRVSEVLRGKRR